MFFFFFVILVKYCTRPNIGVLLNVVLVEGFCIFVRFVRKKIVFFFRYKRYSVTIGFPNFAQFQLDSKIDFLVLSLSVSMTSRVVNNPLSNELIISDLKLRDEEIPIVINNL